MNISQLSPCVRYMDERICLFSYQNPVLAYDYRLFAVRSGCCRLEWENNLITLSKDSLVIFPPAHPYRLLFDSNEPAHLYDINFGLQQSAFPSMAPDEAEHFQPDRMPDPPDQQLFTGLIHVPRAAGLFDLLGDLLREYESDEADRASLCSALLKVILIRALRIHETDGQQPPTLIRQVRRYVEEHCRERLEAAELGRMFGYHPFYLNQIFRQETGLPLHRYQMECRMRRACDMLACTDLSIREIADSLGFSQSSYFSEMFKKMRGQTPGAYRRANQR